MQRDYDGYYWQLDNFAEETQWMFGNLLNLHFTARGAILMALALYGNLTNTVKRRFRDSKMVLLRFRIPLKWLTGELVTYNAAYWNRIYYEHSLAIHKPLQLSAWALETVLYYQFNTNGCQTGTPYTVDTVEAWRGLTHHTFESATALLDTCMKFSMNYKLFYHMPVPLSRISNYETSQHGATGHSRETEEGTISMTTAQLTTLLGSRASGPTGRDNTGS
jgi:hypothetical protein